MANSVLEAVEPCPLRVEDELAALHAGAHPQPKANPSAPPDLREPLGILGLAWPVTLADVKARYKELAKRHHPDANNGDHASEETLKTINLAYAALRGKLMASQTVPGKQAAD